MNRIALGQDISRYPAHVLLPLVHTPEDPVIMVRQVAGVRPEPGTTYSADTLDNGDLVLTKAHSVDPHNIAMDNNYVSLIPSFAETYKKFPRSVF